MICPECKAEGQKSTVTSEGMMTTLIHVSPFWDEDGEYHYHDTNTVSEGFRCSKGHYWREVRKNQCPNPDCSWGKDA